jgi:glycosyltransferase involved in cell wall biosynthesis
MGKMVYPKQEMQPESIRVSVIIPFFKGKKWLSEALKSVLSQTYSNLEIIVINDGSSEDITEVESSFSDKVIFVFVPNGGAALARNIGIANSTGEYIAFLDSDDIWINTKIKDQLYFMEKNGFVWSHTDYIRFNDFNAKEIYVSAALEGRIFPKCLVWNPIATPCVMIKKDILTSGNLGFAVGKKDGEDSYLWEKIGEKYELGYFPSALSKVRIHGKNSAFQAYIQLKGRGETAIRVRLKKHEFKYKLIYYYLLLVLIYCEYAFKIGASISRKFNSDPSDFEYIFKPFYGFAYFNFRIIRILL